MPNDPGLTPAELQSVEFHRAPLGRRGYDEEQVRAFVKRVEQGLIQISNQKAELADEVTRLRQRVIGGQGGVASQDAHIQAVRILTHAQQTADHYVADAERYSREVAQEARLQREEILADAKSRAGMMLEEAHQQAAAAAAAVAGAIPAVPSPEALSGGERREMEREIAYLRTFSDVYRTHLRSYLEALLRNVEQWERSERDSLAVGRPDRSQQD
ncbi:MAG TPA: DivIVA domain-containing protein [Actinomadura sp.]|nr:DivIVA domain-containing protein [Actinomadura sp.]